MKLRIKGNSLRLRLTRSEVSQLGAEGAVEERAHFGGGEVLRYRVETIPGDSGVKAKFGDDAIAVLVSATAAARWAESEEVGMYGGTGPMEIAVEKDFRCLTRAAELEDADVYPNPNADDSPRVSETNPIPGLRRCHREIEEYLAVLSEISARRGGRQLGTADRGRAERCLRYFREVLPQHTADEEESLFPRLRGSTASRDLFDIISTLEEQHLCMDAVHGELDRLFGCWIAERQLTRQASAELDDKLSRLSKTYEEHIRIEEGDIFPFAERMLRSPEMQTIQEETVKRRASSMARCAP